MAHGSSNPTTDLKKIKGTDVDVNTGNASAGTQRVVLATDQPAVPVSLSSTPLPTGAATEATLASRLSESDFDTKVGSLTEAAPANDTASSGLNGRLQRIAQRITSLIALVPTALGQGTMAQSFRVVLPSDWSLPAGTNAIGKLAANSGVDIGDVDVTSVIAGTGATNLGKAEDAAHTTGDVGVMMLAVRRSSPTDLSANTSDGDYEPPQVNRDGAIWTVGAAGPTGGWSAATGTIGATATNIGTSNTAGQVGGWYIFNSNASTVYVQFFNTQASGVSLGSTAPVYSFGIPAGAAANVQPGMVGIAHSTAISIAITTTRSGSTGPSSTVDYNIFYKQ